MLSINMNGLDVDAFFSGGTAPKKRGRKVAVANRDSLLALLGDAVGVCAEWCSTGISSDAPGSSRTPQKGDSMSAHAFYLSLIHI